MRAPVGKPRGMKIPQVSVGGVTHHAGKGGGQEMLPSRHAMAALVGGDPAQRTLQQYAKATPIGAATKSYGDIQQMGDAVEG